MNVNRGTIKSVAALAAIAGLTLVFWGGQVDRAVAGDPPKTPTHQEAQLYANALSEAFSDTADAIQPSVVSIRAVKKAKVVKPSSDDQSPLPGMPNDLPFDNDLLRHFFGGKMPPVTIPPQTGLGSGVIVSADGYILTNNHVVGDADEVDVTLPDGQEHRAKVVGTDPPSDLAVIQIKASDLKPAKLGDSSHLKVGEWVVAAGNPFGLNNTITAGIVSATGRSNMRIADYENFIQTDAAINPGNSGGPLVNLQGEVVGINTAIASHTGSNNGVGFAIPINMAKSIMDSLIKHGQVVRGWLGLSIQPLTADMAKSFGYDSTEGVLIGDVLVDGPAQKAGLKRGDIVTKFAGEQIKDMAQFRTLVAQTRPDTKAKIEVYREGSTKTVKVEVGKMKGTQNEMGSSAESKHGTIDELGISVANAAPDTLHQLGLPEDVRGVLVTQVDETGTGARAGLRVRDVIVDVQGVATPDVAGFREEIAKHDLHKGIRLLVQTGETRHYVLLRTED
ncbi:MAG TPA: DegQ family serine endoprotease [Phycisphaerae bacterium]|nr:DegQ family serine endoprotease [Phycisphaerae bacterium]